MLSRIVDSFSGMPKDLLTIGNEGKGIEKEYYLYIICYIEFIMPKKIYLYY